MPRIGMLWVLVLGSFCGWASSHDTVDFNRGKQWFNQHQDSLAEAVFVRLVQESDNLSTDQLGEAHYYLMQMAWDQDRFAEALAQGDSALVRFQNTDNAYWQGRTRYTLCMKYLILGSYEPALEQIQGAYDQFERARDTAQMIWSLGRKGIVFHDIGKYGKGLATCAEAEALEDRYTQKSVDRRVMIWGITAINHDDGGHPEKAVELYRQILALENELSARTEIVRTYNNLGNSLRKLGRFEEAMSYLQLHLEASEKQGFRYGVATAKTNLGAIAAEQGRLEEAQDLLDEAEAISYAIRDTEKILDVLEQQRLLQEKRGADGRALAYLKRYNAVKDSVYSLDNRRQVQLLETRYKAEKKEQEIALKDARLDRQQAQLKTTRVLLWASGLGLVLVAIIALLTRNRIQRKQELALQQQRTRAKEAEVQAALDSQEQERARYARDLHDGFGQLISILKLNLSSLNRENHAELGESERVLAEMSVELKRICFDMKPQTLVDHGLQAALLEFATRVNATGKLQVQTDFFGLEHRLSMEQEVALFRIVQEWINNILKYSEAQEVTLQVTRDEGELTLLVEDNGQGFDPQLLESGTGNGWRNIRSRVDGIGGDLELSTRPDIPGTSLIVDVPLSVS